MSSSRSHQPEDRDTAGDASFTEGLCRKKKGGEGRGGAHREPGGLPSSRLDGGPLDEQHYPRRITLKSLPGAPWKRSPLSEMHESYSERSSGGCPSGAARRAMEVPGAYAMSRLPEDLSPLSASTLFLSPSKSEPSPSTQRSQRPTPTRTQPLSPAKRLPPRLSDSEQAKEDRRKAEGALFMHDILFSALLGEQ